MHRKYKKKPHKYYLNFCLIRNKCKIGADRCYGLYIDNIQKNIHKCPCTFWNFIDTKRLNREFPNIMSLNDIPARMQKKYQYIHCQNIWQISYLC